MVESLTGASTTIDTTTSIINNANSTTTGQQEIKPYTKKISDETSTYDDKIETDKIISILEKDFNQYENEYEKKKREYILAKLNTIIKDWVKEVGIQEKKDDSTINNSGGTIFTFGSYRLGVHSPDTDIDALCVAPRHIDRKRHFFGILAQRLRSNPSVTKIQEVEEAFVPVIKMEFDGVDIDLLFARVEQQEVSDNLNLLDNNILRSCDT